MLFRSADIDVGASDHPEFRDWRWVPVGALPALAVPFKRPVYETLVARFASLTGPDVDGAVPPLHRPPG